MRLFTGLDLAPAVLEDVGNLVAELKPLARIRWSPVANLHITSKFIGEWPEPRLDELKNKLSLLEPSAFQIHVEGLGFFPNPRAPRVLFAGIAPSPELAELAAHTDAALEELGIARENRPYSPHLTLARISEPLPAELRNRIAPLASRNFGSFGAHEFHLYESKNSAYTKLAAFPLK